MKLISINKIKMPYKGFAYRFLPTADPLSHVTSHTRLAAFYRLQGYSPIEADKRVLNQLKRMRILKTRLGERT